MKKRMIAMLLLFVVAFAFTACNKKDGKFVYKYETKEMLTPFWLTDVMYNESMLLINDGVKIHARPLFKPLEIYSIRDFTLQTEYVEGVDWKLEKNRIVRLDGSSMPYLNEENLYGINMPEGFETLPGKTGKVLHTEKEYLMQYQIAITYKHDKNEWEGEKQAYLGGKLPKTVARLKVDKKLRYVLYGDSIAAGCNTTIGFGLEPMQPSYGSLVKTGLDYLYGAETDYINTAMGGWMSTQGKENALERVAVHNADLVIIAFGMNDASNGASMSTYKNNTKAIIETARAENPDTEFLLLGSIRANPDGQLDKEQPLTINPLTELSEEYEGVAALAMATLDEQFLNYKRYAEYSANNVNHPNDFMHRCMAMKILAALYEF